MEIDITLSLGMVSIVATASYLIGTRWNTNRILINLKQKEIDYLHHNINQLKGRLGMATRQLNDPEINIPEGSTLQTTIMAIMQLLPGKYKGLAKEFGPMILKELQNNPELEQTITQTIKDTINMATKKGTEEGLITGFGSHGNVI